MYGVRHVLFLFRFLVGKDVMCEDLIERGGFIL